MLLSREAIDLDSSMTNVEELHRDIERSISEEYEQDSRGHRASEVQQGFEEQQTQELSHPEQSIEQSIEQVETDLVPAIEDPSRPMEEAEMLERRHIDSQL